MKIASYNISGGFFQEESSKDFFDKEKGKEIDNRLLQELITIINEENLDIICFQEIITTKEVGYIQNIINNTELKYSEYFELSPCHVVENTECGIAILSKYPIEQSEKNLFTNPKLSKQTSSGNVYYTFDKGYLCCVINDVKVLTHHGFPYRRFNSTPEENPNVFKEFDLAITKLQPDIITGDFNSKNFMDLMEYTRNNYIKTINEVTTVDNRMFDNILLKNNKKFCSKIIKSLSDHYMVITEI